MPQQSLRSAALAAAIIFAASHAFSQAHHVGIIRGPGGIMQVLGEPAETDTFVIGNAGTNVASISLAPNSGFFSVTPQSFQLGPRRAQVVTIRAVASDAGAYAGAVTVSVAGSGRSVNVPVRMFIGQRPFGTVNPGLGSNFIILSGRAGQPHRGQLNVSNFGSAIMTCMLVADVPWIEATADIIGVEPRATKNFAFEVNPSVRPDGSSPLGALIGTLGMVYIRGTNGETSISQVARTTATVIDITKASVVPQQPSPLAAGEVASFLAGITDNAATSHVFLSNRTLNALSGVQLFYSTAGSTTSNSLLAALGQFPSASSAWFPYAPGSLFDVTDQNGSIQMRTLQSGQISLSGLLAVVPDGQNLYLTTIPVLTSAAAAGQGQTLIFSGVGKNINAGTDLHIQETAGHPATFTVDFFDANGTAIPPARNETLGAFAYVALANSAPEGAAAARVTNTSTTAAKLGGYATLVDTFTRDRWTITDSRNSDASTDLFVPLPKYSGHPNGAVEVWVTNATTSAVEVAYETDSVSTPGRRRAVRRGTGSAARPGANSVSTFAPRETRVSVFDGASQGYVRVKAPAGAISVAGRVTTGAPQRTGSFGTGVPALSASAATGLGVKKQFSLADDQPSVAPPSLLLLETTGKPATVRVTFRFSFPGGSTIATGQGEASKDYQMIPGGVFTIDDVATAILGADRPDLGRLFKVTIETEVIAGEGRILPYLQTIDTSGDITLFVD